jgi:vacuolar-type H+-ATPase subunit E/Vma4
MTKTQPLSVETQGGRGDPITALCQRVQAIARQVGEEKLQASRGEVSKLLAEARQQAEAEGQAELARTRKILRKQVQCELQSARLEARAQLARSRWRILDGVLDEAGQQIRRLRQTDPARYAAALHHFLQTAYEQLPGKGIVVQVNAGDIEFLESLRQQAGGRHIVDLRPNLREAEIAAGIVVISEENNVILDQSVAQRRRRLDHELRMAAAELLFGTQVSPRGRHP